MLEYLPTLLRQEVKHLGIDEQHRLVRYPTRKYPTLRVEPFQPPFLPLAVRKRDLPVPVYDGGPLRINSCWGACVLCANGLEYTWSGKVIGQAELALYRTE
jgi:hypothetical protein